MTHPGNDSPCGPVSLGTVTGLISLILTGLAVVDEPPPRVHWTTSRVVGSPEPPPEYRTSRLFPAVKFTNPIAAAMPPGDHRWWVAEQKGKVYRIDPSGDGRADLVIDLQAELAQRDQSAGPRLFDALYDITFHPRFEENGECFVCYTVITGMPGEHLPDGTRISRLKVRPGDPPQIDLASEEILITFVEGGHNGGCLRFGPDGFLYISSGDAEGPSPPDIRHTGQDNSDLLSSVLRIDVDRRDEGRVYAIPSDNPFLDREGIRPEIWAYGFRNPWKMSFDRENGSLWVGDVGWELWELVHRVERGGNYGWSIVEGRQPVHADLDPGPSPISPPVVELPHTMGASITGGHVYRGRQFPELRGHYIFGDWETRRIWGWPTEASDDSSEEAPTLIDLVEPTLRIVAFGEDNDRELCIVDYDAGTLHQFERNEISETQTAKFPERLSETGLFASVEDHTVAPGVAEFDVISPQWSDGATAERFIGLPGDGRVIWHRDSTEIPGSMFRRHLVFPENAVLMKTLSLPAAAEASRRVETQLLHYDGRQWRGYSYRWNDAQTDAELVPADGDETDIPQSDGRTLRWTFAGRGQCMVCHNPWPETTLAFNAQQLAARNQNGESPWDTLVEQGVLTRPEQLEASSESWRPDSVLVDPRDPSHSFEQRARSYLHVNCSHCHQNGAGGVAQIDLRGTITEREMKAIDEKPLQGTLGLDEARLIAAGDPYRSVLLLRMAKCGRGRMPHLGSEQPDQAALSLIESWIAGMGDHSQSEVQIAAQKAISGDVMEGDRQSAYADCLKSAATSLALARALDSGQIPEIDRDTLITAAQKAADPVVRDLFQLHFPQTDDRSRVGSSPRPRQILALHGDAARGEKLFWESASLNCKTCHRVHDQGGQAGPELTKIGTTRRRNELLESLLEPSRSVDPRFATFVVQTTDGQVIAGVVTQRDAAEVRLRDSKGELVTIPTGEMESIRTQRASLMPEGLLKDLSLEQAADLLAYLESLK